MKSFVRVVAGVTLFSAAICTAYLGATAPVFATNSGTNRTCAGLDPSRGGAAYTSDTNEQFDVMLADGDVLSYGTGLLVIRAPGAGFNQNLAGPGSITVTAANAGNWGVRRNTGAEISCLVGGVAAVTTTNESSNLDAQQDALSSLLMLHHANTMRMGVEENVDGALSGSGQTNGITPIGFAFSSRALALQHDASAQTMWNAWVRGRFSQYDGNGSSFDGHIGDVFAGLDYQITERMVVGAMLGYGNTDFSTLINTTAGGFDADSFTFGTYAGYEFLPTLRFSASASYTRSDYDNRSGTTVGSFSADRLTLSANLTGRHTFYNGFVLEPTLDFLWATESQDGHTDSAAVVHAANTINAGRVSAGPRLISPDLIEGEGSLRLWSSAMAEYDFANQSPVPASGLPDISSQTSLRLSAGMESALGEGRLSIRADAFGLGSGEFNAYGGSVAYQLPF